MIDRTGSRLRWDEGDSLKAARLIVRGTRGSLRWARDPGTPVRPITPIRRNSGGWGMGGGLTSHAPKHRHLFTTVFATPDDALVHADQLTIPTHIGAHHEMSASDPLPSASRDQWRGPTPRAPNRPVQPYKTYGSHPPISNTTSPEAPKSERARTTRRDTAGDWVGAHHGDHLRLVPEPVSLVGEVG